MGAATYNKDKVPSITISSIFKGGIGWNYFLFFVSITHNSPNFITEIQTELYIR